MHQRQFLHKLLSPVMHKKRLDTLLVLVISLLKWKKLSLTELGRGISLPIQERSGIRRADRFLGNTKLYEEKKCIYIAHIKHLIAPFSKPKIIVDWTNVPNTTHNVLRAALVSKGRALTIYEEVHPEKKLGNVKVQNNFLRILKGFLPDNCTATIITDAGFHNLWFQQILELGWDFVGRVRGTHKYFDGKKWLSCKALILKATLKASCIGHILLCKRNTIKAHLYLVKAKHKGRKLVTRKGKRRRGTDSLAYGRSAKEGWLLASSLSGENFIKIDRVIKLYKKRMQIEEGIRDLKSSQFGFGLEKAHSKSIKRIEVLLLIGMLAAFIAWITGFVGEKNRWQYQYQANSIKSRRVLSLFFLGCRIIRRQIETTISMLDSAVIEAQRLGT